MAHALRRSARLSQQPESATETSNELRSASSPTANIAQALQSSLSSSAPLFGHHQEDACGWLEDERQTALLDQLRHNLPINTTLYGEPVSPEQSLLGLFREYEDYGLPGYTCTCEAQVAIMTRQLVQALEHNTQVTEFLLNLKALEFVCSPSAATAFVAPVSADAHMNAKDNRTTSTSTSPAFPTEMSTPGIAPLLHFLQHNTSLRKLHIRIPPSTKASSHWSGLFNRRLTCANLRELTLWIPRERPQRLRRHMLMTSAPNPRRPVQRAFPASLPRGSSVPAALTSHYNNIFVTNRRRRRPVRFRQSYSETGGNGASGHSSQYHYHLGGVATFAAQQPHIHFFRLQSSSLNSAQWNGLIEGLVQSESLRHVELRRVEVESAVSAGKSLGPLAQRLERIDLHGTIIDVSTLLEKSQQGRRRLKGRKHDEEVAAAAAATVTSSATERRLTKLSWSSANLLEVRRLMSVLSLPSATIQYLELSHLNLNGNKCLLLAQMLQRNTSIQELNLSRAQLDSLDATRLTSGLQANSTLRHLTLTDNQIWKSTYREQPPDLLAAQRNAAAAAAASIVPTPPVSTATRAFVAFAELLSADTPLEYLDLSDNGLETIDQDDRYAILLRGLESNTHLRCLKLCNQANLFLDTLQTIFGGSPRSLHRSVSDQLSLVVQKNQLHELILNYNRLDNAHFAEFVAPALQYNTNLKSLGLKRVGLGNDSVIAMAKALEGHSNLTTLDISYNINITDIGFQALAKTLPTLEKIQTLWFHTMARHREEDAMAQHRYTLIIGQALQDTPTLTTISHPEVLDRVSSFWLLLNQHDRSQLCGGIGPTMAKDRKIPAAPLIEKPVTPNPPDALWPHVFSRLPVDLLAYYVRRNATLMSSVSQQGLLDDKATSIGALPVQPVIERKRSVSTATISNAHSMPANKRECRRPV